MLLVERPFQAVSTSPHPRIPVRQTTCREQSPGSRETYARAWRTNVSRARSSSRGCFDLNAAPSRAGGVASYPGDPVNDIAAAVTYRLAKVGAEEDSAGDRSRGQGTQANWHCEQKYSPFENWSRRSAFAVHRKETASTLSSRVEAASRTAQGRDMGAKPERARVRRNEPSGEAAAGQEIAGEERRPVTLRPRTGWKLSR